MKISHSHTSLILIVSIVLVFQVGCCLTGKPKSTQSPFTGTQTPVQVERPATQPNNTVTVISSGNSIPPGGLQSPTSAPQTSVPVQQSVPQISLPPSRTSPFRSSLPSMTQSTNKPNSGSSQVSTVNGSNVQPGPIIETPTVQVNPTPNTGINPISNATPNSGSANSMAITPSNQTVAPNSQLVIAPNQTPLESTMPQSVSVPVKNNPEPIPEPKKENPSANDKGQTTLNKPVEQQHPSESTPSSEKTDNAPANEKPAETTKPAESRPESLDDISSYAEEQKEEQQKHQSTNDNASFLNASQSKKKDESKPSTMPAVEVSSPKPVDAAKSNDNKDNSNKKVNTADKKQEKNSSPKDKKSNDNLVTLNNNYKKIQGPQGENPKYSGDYSPQATETVTTNFGKPNHANSAQPIEPIEIPVTSQTNRSSSDNVVRLRTIVIP